MSHDKRILTAEGQELLNWVRGICAKLPETTEEIDGFGHTVFRVKGKTFIFMGESAGGEPGAMSVKSDRETQALLIASGRYSKTPYIGHHGWVSLVREAGIDRQELETLIVEGYLMAAPKRLQQSYLASK